MRHTLRDFIIELDAAGELTRVREPVSPILEIAARADAESKKPAPNPPSQSARRNDPAFWNLGGRALLFENVVGSDIPVLINAFGSYRRMEMALGCNRFESPSGPTGFDAIAAHIAELIKPEPPRSAREVISALRRFAPLLRVPPRTVRRGACREIVLTGDAIDLASLPIIKCWPLDGDPAAVGYPAHINTGVPGTDLADDPDHRGRYITFAHIHTIHADDIGRAKPPSHNVGMYRVQLVGRRRLVMHWHMHHDGARHWRSWKKLGRPMPVAIAFGGESVLPFGAIAPLPPGISELLFAGFLNGRGIPMSPGVTIPVRAPANSEIVIEGLVRTDAGMPGYDPRDPHAGPLGEGAYFEGPFGDHTGFYSLPDRYPVVDVTAITTRRDPVFPATVVGLPPQEDYAMGKAVERLFLPLFRTIAPDVEDYDLPLFGCFHNCAVLKIKKEYPLQGRRAMHSVWGAGQMAWTKCVIVVDGDVDPHDTRAVLRAVAERCDPRNSVEFARGPLDILDHAAPALGVGTKLGLDATTHFPGEPAHHHIKRHSDPVELLAALLSEPGVRDAAALDDRTPGILFIAASHDDPDLPARLVGRLNNIINCPANFVILLGEAVNIHNADEALFHWLANCDPGRDRRDFNAGLLFDARPKQPGVNPHNQPARDWPPLLPGVIGPSNTSQDA